MKSTNTWSNRLQKGAGKDRGLHPSPKRSPEATISTALTKCSGP